MIIYNLFPLLGGPFSQWQPHLERAKAMGFDWIFVNPIQYPGMSGSLYSVKDYHQFNPLLLDDQSTLTPEDQVRRMTETAHRMGLKIMIDLVINHCAIDAELIRQKPEWFLWDGDSIAHPSCDEDGHTVVWGDLAKFDHHTHDREGLYQFFRGVVQYLIDLGFDGFRCDAAYQVPRELWSRLIHDTKQGREDMLFAAETLGCTADQTRETAEAGFDYVFNSSKWWDYSSPWLLAQYALIREAAPSISFPESHDTQRLADELNDNTAGLKQRYLFAALFSSGVMMPIGFEYGFRKKLHVVNTRPSDWEHTQIDLTDFIKDVNSIKKAHPVFQEECPTEMLNGDHHNILILWKGSTRTREEALLILNKDCWNYQHFYTETLQQYVQSGAALKCVSPENPLEYVHKPFEYDLRPGEGIVLVTER